MVEIIWSDPALTDLDAIADYIALENPVAASALVKRIFGHVEQLAEHPESGSWPRELGRSRYRQIVESPCRVFYRCDGHTVFVLHVMRSERLFRRRHLAGRAKQARANNSIQRTRYARRSFRASAPRKHVPPHFRSSEAAHESQS